MSLYLSLLSYKELYDNWAQEVLTCEQALRGGGAEGKGVGGEWEGRREGEPPSLCYWTKSCKGPIFMSLPSPYYSHYYIFDFRYSKIFKGTAKNPTQNLHWHQMKWQGPKTNHYKSIDRGLVAKFPFIASVLPVALIHVHCINPYSETWNMYRKNWRKLKFSLFCLVPTRLKTVFPNTQL